MKKKLLVLLLAMLSVASFNQSTAQDAFLGEVKLFAGNYAPRGWMACEGQLLPIAQYSALFSILGTNYGGDGRTTFALPDLRGRVAMGNGIGPGLSSTVIGEKQGSETTTLTIQNLPMHNHEMPVEKTQSVPAVPANDPNAAKITVNQSGRPANQPTTNVGTNQPINNMQPSLTLTYIICVEGIYPSRN